MAVIVEAIRALVERGGLEDGQVRAAMSAIMAGEATPAQIAAFLTALRVRGETPEVIAACWAVLQEHALPCPADNVVDLCGTGGDGADTFNVSTAAAFVVAAAGVRVAKHGNRAASSKCGSADLLEAVGARIDLTGEQAARVIDACGFCFLFAQAFHPAMRHAGPVRREIGIRTVFNIIGPLTNPARPRAQLIGVGAAYLGPLVAQAFALRGTGRALVVHSDDGLDEISPAGGSTAWEVVGDSIRETRVGPADFGLPIHPLSAVAGGDAAANAAVLRAVLGGAQGPVSDFVAMNAGAALYTAGAAGSLASGAAMAQGVLSSGGAADVLERYIRLSNEVANG